MTIDDIRTIGIEAETRADALVSAHVAALAPVLESLARESARLAAWGGELAERLHAGGRLLAAGNGGSAAEAQHLTAEFVGRFDGDRRAFSAIALHADTSSMTAIGNDYGYDEIFARQVHGHARPGDVLLLLSTSGRSRNLLLAARAAHEVGASVWGLTGAAPNPLSDACDECIALPGHGSNVQEAHLVAIHALCRAAEERLRALERRAR